VRKKAAEIVACLYDMWNAGGLPAVSEGFWHEDIEWRDDPSIPDPGVQARAFRAVAPLDLVAAG
jgi:hypothetical protein